MLVSTWRGGNPLWNTSYLLKICKIMSVWIYSPHPVEFANRGKYHVNLHFTHIIFPLFLPSAAFVVGGNSMWNASYLYSIYSWGIKGFNTPKSDWSKTTLITSSVHGAGVNPLFCKMGTFFLRSLALSLPIYRHF